MEGILDYAKQHKVVIAVLVVVAIVVIYFLWFKKPATKTDGFTDKKTTAKTSKKKIPKLGDTKTKKSSSSAKTRKTKQVDADESNDSEGEDSDAVTLSKSLYGLLHDDLSNDTLSLEEFKNLSEGKVGSAVYTELVQLYEDKGDPSRITHRDYLRIVRDHVEK